MVAFVGVFCDVLDFSGTPNSRSSSLDGVRLILHVTHVEQNGDDGGAAQQVDECYEGLAVSLVRPG